MDTIKFIDSCVGAIARKVQDEFDESKHPRDKGGKFTRGSGPRSWSGGGDYKAGPEGKKVSKISNEKADKLNEYATRLEEAGHDPKDIHAMNVQGDLKGMKKALRQYEGEGSSPSSEETDFEKEAKQEIGSGKESGGEDDDASDPVAKMRKHLDDDLFELATRSESEEEFISKAERRIKQDLWAAKSAPEELPVKGQKAEYALKKILSEIKSGTSEYW